jgi:hypothetical protein
VVKLYIPISDKIDSTFVREKLHSPYCLVLKLLLFFCLDMILLSLARVSRLTNVQRVSSPSREIHYGKSKSFFFFFESVVR